MAGSINKVILVGNVGQEPQVRTMQSGQKVVSFSLATSDRWRDRATGEQKEQTEWHRVVIFNPNLVEVAERMLQKGTKLYLEGSLRTRKWQNQQGRCIHNRSGLESIFRPDGDSGGCQEFGFPEHGGRYGVCTGRRRARRNPDNTIGRRNSILKIGNASSKTNAPHRRVFCWPLL